MSYVLDATNAAVETASHYAALRRVSAQRHGAVLAREAVRALARVGADARAAVLARVDALARHQRAHHEVPLRPVDVDEVLVVGADVATGRGVGVG